MTMKRALLILLFALVPAALIAQVADRDVLLTPDGTLYTVESVADGPVTSEATRYLNLTIQRGTDKAQSMPVPESLTAGTHWRPALAYDSDSKTLFVLWLKMPNGMSSELMLASYSNGRWQQAVSIDNQPYHLRFNLRIGITRRVSQMQKDGSFADVPELLVHAVWWEQTGYDETARYALLSIEKGRASLVELHDLAEFGLAPGLFPNVVDANFNPEILKHPAFVDNGTQNSIDVIFGDPHMYLFNRVTLKPIADGRIHIPIGAHPGGPRIMMPYAFSADWTGRISTIAGSHDGSLLLYNTTADAVNYILFSNGTWSTAKTLPLSDKLSSDGAVAVLTRMLNQ
jgi:hypothetical protein